MCYISANNIIKGTEVLFYNKERAPRLFEYNINLASEKSVLLSLSSVTIVTHMFSEALMFSEAARGRDEPTKTPHPPSTN
jgi:hypothetical protein